MKAALEAITQELRTQKRGALARPSRPSLSIPGHGFPRPLVRGSRERALGKVEPQHPETCAALLNPSSTFEGQARRCASPPLSHPSTAPSHPPVGCVDGPAVHASRHRIQNPDPRLQNPEFKKGSSIHRRRACDDDARLASALFELRGCSGLRVGGRDEWFIAVAVHLDPSSACRPPEREHSAAACKFQVPHPAATPGWSLAPEHTDSSRLLLFARVCGVALLSANAILAPPPPPPLIVGRLGRRARRVDS